MALRSVAGYSASTRDASRICLTYTLVKEISFAHGGCVDTAGPGKGSRFVWSSRHGLSDANSTLDLFVPGLPHGL